MRFLLMGADEKTGNERTIETEAEDEQAALTIAKTEGVYTYKVQQIAPAEARYDEVQPPPIIRDEVPLKIERQEGRHSVNDISSTAVKWINWVAFATIAIVAIALVALLIRAEYRTEHFDREIEQADEKAGAEFAALDTSPYDSITDAYAPYELPTDRTYSEKLLAAIRREKKLELERVPSLLFVPLPEAQELFCKVFQLAGTILASKTTNELQQNELDERLEKTRQKLSQRVEFQRWLVNVKRIEIVDEGVVKVQGSIGSLFFHGTEFLCRDPDVIATLADLNLPAVVEIDGLYTGDFDDLGVVHTEPLVVKLGDRVREIAVGHSLLLKFELHAIRTLYDDAGEAMLMERIEQEKISLSSN